MKKATDALLRDHKMIRKLLDGFTAENPRFLDVTRTLERVVLTHAWFEDTVFLPVCKVMPIFESRYLAELDQEHRDLEHLLSTIHAAPAASAELDARMKQFRAILETHLKKEEDALFPLAETVLTTEGMNRLSAEMERRQAEAQNLFNRGTAER